MAKSEQHIFNNEKDCLTNFQNAYDTSDSGRYNDVEFSLSDGSRLKANKFVLASQSKYFDTMFYGSLKHDGNVPLKWCSKASLMKVFDFLSVGKVDIGDLGIMELLELLEAARLMCLVNLSQFVESYVKHLIESSTVGKIPPVQAFMALDFAIVKHFENVTNWLLQFIDENMKDYMNVRTEEVGVLSSNGMIVLLGYEGTAKRIELLKFFLVWKEASQNSGIEIAQFIKLQDLNAQELKTARVSDLYPLAEITNNLEKIVLEYETTIEEAYAKNKNLKEKMDDMTTQKNHVITEKEKLLVKREQDLKEKSEIILEKCSENANLNQTIFEQKSEIAKLKCSSCKKGGFCGNLNPCNKCDICQYLVYLIDVPVSSRFITSWSYFVLKWSVVSSLYL